MRYALLPCLLSSNVKGCYTRPESLIAHCTPQRHVGTRADAVFTLATAPPARVWHAVLTVCPL